MRLEDMSFYDYLLAECEYREKQRRKGGERMKIAEKIHEYNVNHNAEWLRDVCSLMRTSSEVARKNDFDKGWNDALTRVIGIIEDGMIPPQADKHVKAEGEEG